MGYVVRSDGDPIYGLEFERDKLGRITQKIEWIDDGTSATTKTWDYEYDNADRLTTVTLNGGSPGVYAYDDNGNRLSYTSPASVLTEGEHDAQDRLTSYGSIDYTYTAAGDLLTKTDGAETTAYAYDEEGNLLSVVIADGSTTKTVEYLLDAAGRRIGKKLDGDLVQGFIPGGLLPAAETDAAGRIVSLFFRGGMWSKKENGTDWVAYRFVLDQVGSIRMVVRADNGTVVQRIDYDEFGRIPPSGDSNPGFQPFGFAGGLYDEDTTLVRFGARDYDPFIGRWTSKEPLGFAGSYNFYSYCDGDPVNYRDSTGLMAEDWELYGDGAPPQLLPSADSIRTALDIVGTVEPTPFADLGSGAISACKGDALEAVGSLAGAAFPYIGDVAKWICKYKKVAGVYEFTSRSGKKYIGQAKDVYKRLKQHLASKKLPAKNLPTVKVKPVSGGEKARKVRETQEIIDNGDLQNLENKIYPIKKQDWKKYGIKDK